MHFCKSAEVILTAFYLIPRQALGEAEAANAAFSTSLSLWPGLAVGWLSWGAHCDAMFLQTGNATWLEYAVTCYLQARLSFINTAVCDLSSLSGGRSKSVQRLNLPKSWRLSPVLRPHISTASLQAIRNGSAAARNLLPRVLGLLSFDDVGDVVRLPL